MQNISPQSPEERSKRRRVDLKALGPGGGIYEVGKRVVVGVFNDGFIHAGNLAYLTLLTLFPFFIVIAALASLLGRSEDTLVAVGGFLATLPPEVRALLETPIVDVLTAQTGSLLWLGGLIGLWTVGSFIETVRDILRRAYGTTFSRPFWQYRLRSIGVIIGSVIVMMVAFSAQVLLAAAEQFVLRLVPFADDVASLIGLSKLVPLFIVWGALFLMIFSLTPGKYRDAPKWPGALFIALWWYGALGLLPVILTQFADYDLTYGSLAGVIITLFFFWIIGLGIVIGAHLNAALAEPPQNGLRDAKESVTEPS
ncbi:MAG: YihY/virulence factor BrkB family protein [Sphingomonadaceae bacterium]